ncbi:alanyl-tRNA editing protein [Brevibacillus fluminis]|uniref:Alanyl-tRNA editing protein n=1 Tax=Brevibacillus fluminis TaxID=511487 RepID=A0A3M8DV82_9BACL|nr:alanyl-tRNA editing protein [Brevibacillus fluminis]RNB92006.1 alanyl-tRNA editing protein [Brevibacillus fluminis]
MVKKIFWEDPYQTKLDTTVKTVEGNEVTLSETILYALAGGQESDAGTIGGYPVLQARKAGQEIVYTLEDGHRLTPGMAVSTEVDWDRRYKLMRLHFAAEIILELVYQNFGPITKIGAHIAQEKARIDFEWEENIANSFTLLTEKAHALIGADHPIISAFSDPEVERRYWEISGFARVSCGGTHLKRTGEVGQLRLKRNNIGKGKERIEITLVQPDVTG